MDFPWLLVLALLVSVVVLFALWRWERGRPRRRSLARLAVAAAGEVGAEEVLRARGFAVVERQAWAEWTLRVDGEPIVVGCRADLVVERRGERWIAEVKTGALAPDPLRPATRRQLLEYAVAFGVDGVLLVDMAAAAVKEIRFDAVLE